MLTDRLPRLLEPPVEVPLATGGTRRYVTLDCAASTPAMSAVLAAVESALPWYSSVHRGAGHLSQVSTQLYEAARQAVGAFVGAGEGDTVIFVRNTTEAINVAATVLAPAAGGRVLTTAVEHHANLLPWRRVAPVTHLHPPDSAAALVREVDRELARGGVAVLAMTAASNVTGEIFPVAAVAELAHAAGARVLVDGAQLVPHRAVDMHALGADCLAFSGHKMYAPFGAGALVMPRQWLATAEPLLAGGGAVDFVTLEDVLWTAPPERHEAGSPNVIGAVALAAACTALASCGMDAVADHERELLSRLDNQLQALPGLTLHRLWSGPGVDRLGVVTFTVAGYHHALVAAYLSAEHAIGVRHGCFCAHPYITHLLGVTPAEAATVREQLRRGDHVHVPGAVRASMGIGTTTEDVDRLSAALEQLLAEGPRLEYDQDAATGDFLPRNDQRALPVLPGVPCLDGRAQGGGCGSF